MSTNEEYVEAVEAGLIRDYDLNEPQPIADELRQLADGILAWSFRPAEGIQPTLVAVHLRRLADRIDSTP